MEVTRWRDRSSRRRDHDSCRQTRMPCFLSLPSGAANNMNAVDGLGCKKMRIRDNIIIISAPQQVRRAAAGSEEETTGLFEDGIRCCVRLGESTG